MVSPKEGSREPLPLAALRVLVTRTAAGASAWAEALEAVGARAIVYPTIETVPSRDLSSLDRGLETLARFDGVIFTSVTAVDITCTRPAAPRSVPDGTTVVAVGASTEAALRMHGWPPRLVPEDQRQEGILSVLPSELTGKRFFFPQAAGGRELLSQELRARGAEVEVVMIYETVASRPLPPLPAFDVALFASPSALRSFAEWHGLGIVASRPFAVLGPTTAAAARRLGLVPAAEAPEPSVKSLIEVLSSVVVPRERLG